MMNNNDLDNQDEGLVSFLKKNAPDIPKTSDGLEDRIMKAISAEESPPLEEESLFDKLKQFFNPYIFIPASIAVAALLVAAIILPIGKTTKDNSLEMAETGDFVEYVWETGYEDYWDNDLTAEINEIMEL
ncbi:MAG: hypothetical protein ABIJ24_03820 [Nitrospinota bacterium]|nr:hypothetical protein [Nitrospinota bacterium]